MIASAADYNWIAGDFDVSGGYPLINGEIMPLRTGTSATTGVANSKIHRGEDVCFLAEAAKERNYCFNGSVVQQHTSPQTINVSEQPFPFSRKASSQQLRDVVGLYADLFGRTYQDLRVRFLDKSRLAAIDEVSQSAFNSAYQTMYSAAMITSGDQTATSSDFNDGSPLSGAAVQRIFNDLQKLDTPFVTFSPEVDANTGKFADVTAIAGDGGSQISKSLITYFAGNNFLGDGGRITWQGYWIPDYVAASIPATYFAAAEIWGGYYIELSSYSAGYPGNLICDRLFEKLGDMTVENGRLVWSMTLDKVKDLMTRGLARQGLTLPPYTALQNGGWVRVSLWTQTACFIVPTLTDRTKWTTPSNP